MAVEIVRRIQEESGAPDVPANLVIGTVTTTTVALSWDASPNIEFSFYTVYRSSDGVSWGFVTTTVLTNYTDTPPDLGVWYFAISATDEQGNESAKSDPISVELSPYPWYDASQRLGTPNALPAALAPFAAGDRFRQNGPITPAGYGSIIFSNYGYLSATFTPQQSPTITYSTHAVGAQVTGTGTLTIPLAAANPNLLGKMLLLFMGTFGTGETLTTPPTGYQLLTLANNDATQVWWKVGTASETAPQFAFSGAGIRLGWMLARTSSSGWAATTPLIGTPVSAVNSSLTSLRYQAYTVPAVNLDSYQVSVKLLNTGAANPVSAVGVTSGYTTAGSAISNVTNGLVLAAQVHTADAYSINLATNDVATTGNTLGGGSRRVSFSIKGAVTFANQAFTVPMRHYRASTGVDTTYNLVLNP